MRTRFTARDGFTLIELMVVIVIIGILASMALATWQNRKEEALIAGLKSDLRNLAAAQESYFVDNNAYASDTNVLEYRQSPQVVVTVQADEDGWTANAAHPSTTKECGLYIGAISPLSPARGEGVVWCE